MVDLPCSIVTRLMSATTLLLMLGVQSVPAATVTVDFGQLVAIQSMLWGTNEVEGQLRPSAVAVARLQEINSRCIRYWLSGDVRPDASTWDWPRLDEGVDRIVASGATPMICFAGIPDWMAISPNPGKPDTWNHPRDLNEWAAYCIAIVRHCADRHYPIEEWYWEIWNEPNNGGVSGGWSVADYLALYDAAASALRQAFPTIRIGGPSTDHASENWIVPLLQGHDVQFITWHRYGAWDPTLAKSSESYLSETDIYGSEAAKVKNWIETQRPGQGILNVCGEINLNAYCCPIDSRIWEPMLIPWYTSVMRHLLLNGCDVEQFFVGTDKSWPNYGLFLGTGGSAGLRSPAFFAKQLFTTAAPPGSELTACQISGSSTLEALAVRTPLGRRHVILINKTAAQTPVALSITGTEIAGGIWYTIDADSYAAGGITAHVSAGGSSQAITLVGYATTVLAICEPGEVCNPDRDGDGLLNLFDNCPDTPSSDPFDSDFDGVGDACDLCPDTPRGEPVNSTGCRHVRSDFDRDLDVDMEDFGHIQACLTGPGIAQPALACRSARLDDDSDVDDGDVAIFLRCLSGPGVPANSVCESIQVWPAR